MQKRNTFMVDGTAWYDPVVATAETLGRMVMKPTILHVYAELLRQFPQDDYLLFVRKYIEKGLAMFGDDWRYADLGTVLLGLARVLQPETYLEVGVRTGRSMAMVASQARECAILGFDMLVENYAGMDNPGFDVVEKTMRDFGHEGHLQFIEGNSHETLPRFFEQYPQARFDLITVDGDHTDKGARQDIADVLPRLKVGGVIVFDDIIHPKHRYLYDVWREMVAGRDDFSTFEYDETGYGVALGVRHR